MLNEIFNYEREITTREVRKAIKHAAGDQVHWIMSNVVAFKDDQKATDGWLKRDLAKYAKRTGKVVLRRKMQSITRRKHGKDGKRIL